RRLLAFTGTSVDLGAPLFTADLAGGRSQALGYGGGFPSWGPGGRLYYVSRRDGLPDLWGLPGDPETGKRDGPPRRPTAGPGLGEYTSPPNGQRLIAPRQRQQSQLWSFPASEAQLGNLKSGKQLTGGGFEDQAVAALPDGGLVFQSTRRGKVDVWRVGLDGGAPLRLSKRKEETNYPKPNPKKAWVAVSVVADDESQMWVMRPDGGGAQPLLDAPPPEVSEAYLEAWAPDGERFVFSCAHRTRGQALGLGRFDAAT